MPETQITITVPADLRRVTDDYLAALWHLAQFNPAPLGDKQAEKIVGAVTTEIVRRWLAKTKPSMHHHQPGGHHWGELRRFAKYEPGADDFDAGQWVARASVTHWHAPGLVTTTLCQGEPLDFGDFAALASDVNCPPCRALLDAGNGGAV